MTTATVLVIVYLGAGLVCAVILLLRGPAGAFGRGPAALLALVLWPFLAPTLWPGERGPARPGAGARLTRIDEAAARIEEGLRRAAPSAANLAGTGRERAVLDGFVARLRANELRLRDIEEAIATAPASVRERLVQLKDRSACELEKGIDLLEELGAQLILLRFADVGAPSAGKAERDHVEELLVRIESLAMLVEPGEEGVHPPG